MSEVYRGPESENDILNSPESLATLNLVFELLAEILEKGPEWNPLIKRQKLQHLQNLLWNLYLKDFQSFIELWGKVIRSENPNIEPIRDIINNLKERFGNSLGQKLREIIDQSQNAHLN